MLSERDRMRLMEDCAGHAVAYCSACRVTYEFCELGALRTEDNGAPVGADQEQPGNHCPGCGADLTTSLLEHLAWHLDQEFDAVLTPEQSLKT